MVPISDLVVAESPRTHRENSAHILRLAESEEEFDPIMVHRPTMRVIDGVHRLRATALRGRREIAVRLFDGSDEDAFVLAVETNIRHGLPLTLAERKRAASRIIGSHPQWSDRAIAERTGLSAKTVGKLRRNASEEIPHLHARIGRDGRVRPVRNAEGRYAVAALLQSDPGASLRELASKAGVSMGTVRDVRDRLRRGEDPVPPGRRPDHPRRQSAVRVHPVPAVPDPDVLSDVRKLTRDPSLRATEAGRQLLRMLVATTLATRAWDQILASVPEHCALSIRNVALQRSAELAHFANLLGRRAPGDAEG
jgi:ParB-like chromosome segregation protein Spo0J